MHGIQLHGCRENNLKNISLIIPYSKIVAITGVSGSGKSSLAFDTLFAEGKRRYIEAMDVSESYFLAKVKKPEADLIVGVPPAIALIQNRHIRDPRSTVGTITHAVAYLQLLFATCGETPCKACLAKGRTSNINVSRGRCAMCGSILPTATPSIFSPNSPKGMCLECGGAGQLLNFDETLIWPDQELSVGQGGLRLGGPTRGTAKYGFFDSLLRHYGATIDTPINTLPNEAKIALLYGVNKSRKLKFDFPGIINEYTRIYKQTKSPGLHEEIEGFMVRTICAACKGSGINATSLEIMVDQKPITWFLQLSLSRLRSALSEPGFTDYRAEILKTITARCIPILESVISLGTCYLSLERKVVTLSGGEMQRVLLAAQISSEMSGVVYVLDEPSTGMHHRDIGNLIANLKRLSTVGNSNTIVLVEHDLDIIKAADYVIDVGPGAGTLGGHVVSQGTPSDIAADPASITGKYLSRKATAARESKAQPAQKWISIVGARANNLKVVEVRLPLQRITCLSGVSGSGKTSLLFDSFYDVIDPLHPGRPFKSPKVERIVGMEEVNRVVLSDQAPIGKSSRSNPATYSEAYGFIRELFAKTPEAKQRRFDQRHFSFNSESGRCEECKGSGYIKIEMNFMPELAIPCESCGCTRFKAEVLKVSLNGKNIAEVLDMNVDDALVFFSGYPQITRRLHHVSTVGLGYLRLGQETATLSGGESQRLKLAYELSKGATSRTLFLFDEPSSGLHPQDIGHLLGIFKDLVDKGNTIVIIEHNLDIIASCDHVIDLGPDAGDEGGQVVGEGSPTEISELQTPTGKALQGYFLSQRCVNASC